MKEHLDLRGASGAIYRFQLIRDDSKVPAEGGNFVYVRHDGDVVSIIFCGVSDTLHDARQHWAQAAGEHRADAIFVRRNITRSQREREHNDIVAESNPVMTAS